MNAPQFIPILAAIVAVCAAVTDLDAHRIPNRLTYTAMLIGLTVQTVLHGRGGLGTSVLGGLFFGGVFFLFYLVRAMGAGDVKLAAAIGCIVGLKAVVPVLFATALAGGALAVVYMALSGRVVETLRNTLAVVAFHGQHGLHTHPTINLENPTSARMPYGLAFAAGTVYWALSTRFWS